MSTYDAVLTAEEQAARRGLLEYAERGYYGDALLLMKQARVMCGAVERLAQEVRDCHQYVDESKAECKHDFAGD